MLRLIVYALLFLVIAVLLPIITSDSTGQMKMLAGAGIVASIAAVGAILILNKRKVAEFIAVNKARQAEEEARREQIEKSNANRKKKKH